MHLRSLLTFLKKAATDTCTGSKDGHTLRGQRYPPLQTWSFTSASTRPLPTAIGGGHLFLRPPRDWDLLPNYMGILPASRFTSAASLTPMGRAIGFDAHAQHSPCRPETTPHIPQWQWLFDGGRSLTLLAANSGENCAHTGIFPRYTPPSPLTGTRAVSGRLLCFSLDRNDLGTCPQSVQVVGPCLHHLRSLGHVLRPVVRGPHLVPFRVG